MSSCFYDCGYIIKPEYVEFENVFEIGKRVKEIDNNYLLLYNRIKKQFEVHNISQLKDTFVFSVKKENLNARFLEYLRKTRKERMNELFYKIELQNMQNEIKKSKLLKEKYGFLAKEILDLSNYKNGELSNNDINNIKNYMKE